MGQAEGYGAMKADYLTAMCLCFFQGVVTKLRSSHSFTVFHFYVVVNLPHLSLHSSATTVFCSLASLIFSSSLLHSSGMSFNLRLSLHLQGYASDSFPPPSISTLPRALLPPLPLLLPHGPWLGVAQPNEKPQWPWLLVKIPFIKTLAAYGFALPMLANWLAF